jgi:PAS domain S-box-containing protein
MPVKNNKTKLKQTIPARLVVTFILFTLGIILSGLIYQESQRKRIFSENQNYLTAISELKTRQIEQWYRERLGDAKVIKDNEPLIRSIAQYFDDRRNPDLRKELTKWMESVCREYDYNGVSVVDTLFRSIISVSLTDSVKTDNIRMNLGVALETDSIIFTDLHRTGNEGEIHIDILIPLVEPGTMEQKPFGILILRIDPGKILFPLIQSWPTPSKTAETLLLSKDGDSILFLNELRHKKNTALNMKIPLTSEDVLGVKAIQGFKGISEGEDYRNIKVFGYLDEIEGLPWYMVTKIDQEELLAPLRKQSFHILVVIILLIVTNALIFVFFIWNQRVNSYRIQFENERAIREAEEKFKYVFDNSVIGKSITLLSGEMSVNKAFCYMLGYSYDELKNKKWQEISYPEDIESTQEFLELLISGQTNTVRFSKRYIHKNGSIIWGDVSTVLRRDSDNKPMYFMTAVSDITDLKRVEAELRFQSEIMTNMAEAVYLVRMADGIIVYSNTQFEILFGYGPGEMVGKHVSIVNAPSEKSPEDTASEIINTLSVQGYWKGEVENVKKDGTHFWCYASVSIFDHSQFGKVLVSVHTDITEQKRAVDDLSLLALRQEAILSAVPDIIMEVDNNKVYTWANQSGIDFFGKDVIGKEASVYFEGDQKTYEVVQPLFNGEVNSIYLESWQIRIDGQKRLLGWWCRALKDKNDNLIGAISSALDITENKIAESKIRALNEELELRVIQRTEQLEAANKELEAFSYSVSHDLRSPLRSVNAFTNILMEDYGKILDEEGKRICGIITSSATQMGELIDDLLSFSRIGRSQMSLALIDMKSMAASVFEEIVPAKDKGRINLKIGKLPKIHGDSKLIRLVWINLISNAIKYSSKEKIPEITIGSRIEEGKAVYFISDNGVGFDMQYVHKLFRVFQRLHGEDEFEGNGVGLAIVQRIILRHEGNVWAEGEVGNGAIFYFSLPVQVKSNKSEVGA